jgi:hypothetical protein
MEFDFTKDRNWNRCRGMQETCRIASGNALAAESNVWLGA